MGMLAYDPARRLTMPQVGLLQGRPSTVPPVLLAPGQEACVASAAPVCSPVLAPAGQAPQLLVPNPSHQLV